MKYRDAKKLHNGDEVAIKENNAVLRVISVVAYKNAVIVECEDGNEYHHKDIR